MTTIDSTEADHRATNCHWCGTESDELVRYGTRHLGQTYWSPALCGTECHDEMFGG